MKKLALIALVFVALGASAQQDTLKYRISLKDKAATTYSLDHPEKFLSEKSHRPPPASAVACRLYRSAGLPSVCGCHSRQGSEDCGYGKMG